MIVALLLGAAIQAASLDAPPPEPCLSICDAAALRPFFDKLARVQTEGRTVRIMQIGDSHTAGDQITGAWRAALQARYGNAGRGVLAPGRPYQGYLTRDVTAQQSAGWSVAGIFGPTYRSANTTPVGVANYSFTALSDGAQLSIAADRDGFDRFTACALTGPGAGTLTLTIGSVVRPVALAAARVESRCVQVEALAAPVATLSVAGGPVTVTSWSTERAAPGVILSNLGTVGAQLIHFARTDDRLVATEIAQYRPDLLVIAFGTNEAFTPRFSASDYASRLRAGIARVKRLAPDTPILILGAPDSATTRPEIQTGESGRSAPCTTGLLSSFDATLQDWRPTAALGVVQATQRRVAHDEGVAFWDWSRAMGGRCTPLQWARTGLMRGDRVHFTSAGAKIIADRLQADLDAAAFAVGAVR